MTDGSVHQGRPGKRTNGREGLLRAGAVLGDRDGHVSTRFLPSGSFGLGGTSA